MKKHILLFFVLLSLCFEAFAFPTIPTTRTIALDGRRSGADIVDVIPVAPPTGQSNYGYQPALATSGSRADTSDTELLHDFDSILEAAYQGKFALGNYAASPHPEIAGVSTYNARIGQYDFADSAGSFAFGPQVTVDSVLRDTFFYCGQDGAFNGDSAFSGNAAGRADSCGQFLFPLNWINPTNINDRTGIEEAPQQQPWAAPFKDGFNDGPSTNTNLSLIGTETPHTISGAIYLTTTQFPGGLLCLAVTSQYDVGPDYNQNTHICHTNPSNLSDATAWRGYFRVQDLTGEQAPGLEAHHTVGWMTEIPAEHQTALGGTHLVGGGCSQSIISRGCTGPTLFAGSFDNLPTSGPLSFTRHMDFWDIPGMQMGAFYYETTGAGGSTRWTGSAPWYNHEYMNCDRDLSSYNCGNETTDTNEIRVWVNDWFNILSYGVEGFILPGTRTYVVIGTIDAGKGGASYKGFPDWRNNRCTGPCRAIEDDQYNKYWLFDLDEIAAAANPWEVFPYEHGYLDFLDQTISRDGIRARMINAKFDLDSGQLAIVMRNMHGGSDPRSDVFMFSDPSWAE